MTDAARAAQKDYGKEKYELANRVAGGETVGAVAFAQHCGSYAKEGWRAGYKFAKREDAEKTFSLTRQVTQFRKELDQLCGKYGFQMGTASIDLRVSNGKNAQYSEVILIDIEKAKNRYVTDVITKMEK